MKTKSKHSKTAPIRHVRKVVQVTPKFIHGMVIGAVFGALLVGSLRYATITSADSANTCQVTTQGPILAQDNTASVRFNISDHGCSSAKISLAVYERHQATLPLSSQKLFSDSEAVFKTGSNTISTPLPPNQCYFQADLWVGSAPHQLLDSDPYHNPNVLPYVVASLLGGANDCLGTPTSTPTPIPTPTSTPLTTTTATPPPSTPSTLVNTGPGAVIIIGLLAVLGGYIHHIRHHHRRLKRSHR